MAGSLGFLASRAGRTSSCHASPGIRKSHPDRQRKLSLQTFVRTDCDFRLPCANICLHCPRVVHQCVYLSTPWEEASRRLIKHPCELEAWERWLKCPFQPGAWNKRSREQRPLTGVGKLAERERAGDGDALQCRTPLALGTQRLPTPVKGGIAHATG